MAHVGESSFARRWGSLLRPAPRPQGGLQLQLLLRAPLPGGLAERHPPPDTFRGVPMQPPVGRLSRAAWAGHISARKSLLVACDHGCHLAERADNAKPAGVHRELLGEPRAL